MRQTVSLWVFLLSETMTENRVCKDEPVDSSRRTKSSMSHSCEWLVTTCEVLLCSGVELLLVPLLILGCAPALPILDNFSVTLKMRQNSFLSINTKIKASAPSLTWIKQVRAIERKGERKKRIP